MSNIDIIRAWKDDEYRNSLSEEQKNSLPKNPAGEMNLMELSPEQTNEIRGGFELPERFPAVPLRTESSTCITISGRSICGVCVSGFTASYVCR